MGCDSGMSGSDVIENWPANISGGILDSRDRVIRFQKYLLKRSWGLFYALWALVMFLFLATDTIAFSITGIHLLSESISTLLDMISFFLALYFVQTIFTRSRNSARLIGLGTSNPGISQSNGGLSWILMILYFTSILILPLLKTPPAYFQGVQMGVFLGYSFLMYRAMRSTFGRVDLDGILTLSSFMVGSVTAFSLSIFSADYALYFLCWGSVIFIWIFSSVLALYSAPDEMGEAHV